MRKTRRGGASSSGRKTATYIPVAVYACVHSYCSALGCPRPGIQPLDGVLPILLHLLSSIICQGKTCRIWMVHNPLSVLVVCAVAPCSTSFHLPSGMCDSSVRNQVQCTQGKLLAFCSTSSCCFGTIFDYCRQVQVCSVWYMQGFFCLLNFTGHRRNVTFTMTSV